MWRQRDTSRTHTRVEPHPIPSNDGTIFARVKSYKAARTTVSGVECQQRAIIAPRVWIFRNFALHLVTFIVSRFCALYVRLSGGLRILERRCGMERAHYLRILKIYLTKWTHFNFRAVRAPVGEIKKFLSPRGDVQNAS